MKKEPEKQESIPAAAPPAPKYEAAHCVEACDVNVGTSVAHRFFGGDIITESTGWLKWVRGCAQFKLYTFKDRAAYEAWLSAHDMTLAEVRQLAAEMGYELVRHGEVLETVRGRVVHREARGPREC